MAPIKRFIVRGRVQGVGFRWWTYEEATHRLIDGFVRNRRDGTVEVVVADSLASREFVELLASGPPGAIVTAVEAEDCELGAEEIPDGFEIRRR